MCGICCIFAPINNFNKEEINKLYHECETNLTRRGPDYQSTKYTTINNWNFLCNSSVLWLQGEHIVTQPIETDKSWFLYNGDVFGNSILPSTLRHTYGDTKPLLDFIENSESIVKALSDVQGPYAFILIDKIKNKLYFGRDTFGRRSLLMGKDKNTIILTSVASRKMHIPMLELPAIGIYCINLNLNSLKEMILHPWLVENQHFEEKLTALKEFLSVNIIIENYYKSENVTIFKDPSESDICLLTKLESLKVNDSFKLILKNKIWISNILKLQSLLEDAIYRRINNQPPFCKDCMKQKISCQHSLIGVLFSGGLDCAILSLLADKYIEKSRPIDLMNVAFEKGNYDTPDRLTARQTYKELQKLCPNRKWNLLEINITQEELNFERNNHITNLIYPLDSILDESLGCALWFAARGKTELYTSPCRVLLVGMGADELFGGYTRHKAAFKRGSWKELTRELENDWKNISHRNLARDDRVISDHGRQVRTPYLDENVVEFVRKLHSWERCYPSERVIQGLGDKLLLRSLAYNLGLPEAAVLKKRALQFGSRIANSKENAHEKSPRL